MKRVILLIMILLISVSAFAKKNFDYEDFMNKLDGMIPKFETKRQYESRQQPTTRYDVYVEERESYQPSTVYQAPVYQTPPVSTSYYPAYSSSQAGRGEYVTEESKLLIPILIIGLAVLVVEGFAIWYLNKKLFGEFGYDIFSPGKLFLFGVQTLPMIILVLKGMFYGFVASDIAFGLGFIGIIAGIQFYMDKRNTNLKYATILLFVRLVASLCVVIIVIILIALLYLWLLGTGGGGRKEDELTDDEVRRLKRLAQDRR